jgi:hypothetical protein
MMKKLKIAVKITFALSMISAVALFFQLLALADIAQNKEDLKLEWYITGISMIILGVFVISTIVTLGMFFKNREWR